MAAKISLKLNAGTRIGPALFAAVGAHDPRPKLVIRPDCTVIWHSDNARRLLQPPLPIRLRPDQIKFDDHIRPARMQQFFEGTGPTVHTCLLRSKTKGHWMLLNAWLVSDRPAEIALVCSLSTPCRGVVESGLAAELKLTPSEAQVLDLFAKLSSPAQIADELEVSLGTVRSHLKQVYSKAGLNSAVQLLQLARGYCDN